MRAGPRMRAGATVGRITSVSQFSIDQKIISLEVMPFRSDRRRRPAGTGAAAARFLRKKTYRLKGHRLSRSAYGVPTVHRFRRACLTQTVTGSIAFAPYTNGQSISLADVIKPLEFTELFDSYRIDRVTFKFYMTVAPDAQSATAATYPRMWWHIDNDDASSPTNLQELKEDARTKCAVLDPRRPITVSWRPSTLALTFNTPVQSTFSPKWGQWVDCAFSGTPHYGIKYAIDNFTNTNYKLDIERVVWFSCKNSR